MKCSDFTLTDINLADTNYISFKLGVRPDAAHVGGMNLFGEKFGDYAQGLIMSLTIENQPACQENTDMMNDKQTDDGEIVMT